MTRQIIFTPKAAKPPATYSQAVKAAGLIFVSGTAPHDPQTGALVGATIQEQTGQCLKNVAAILESAGSSLEKVCKHHDRVSRRARFPGHERGVLEVVSIQSAGPTGGQVASKDTWAEGVHRRGAEA